MEFYWHKLTNGDEAMFNKIHITPDDIPVCLEIYNQDNPAKPFKTFGVFKSSHQFLEYIANTEISKRCFFEIIKGSHAQKHYVDIDMELEDDLLNDLYSHSVETKIAISKNIVGLYVNALLSIRKEISLEDILVFNSNSSTKRSFHIIVDRWFFPSATQNKELFEDVLNKIDPQYHKYFDKSMYKSIQQFRTMLSTKCGRHRFKVLDKQSTWKLKYDIKDPNMKMRELFYASLVTEVIGTCQMLSFEYKEKIAYVPSRDINNYELEIVIHTFREKFHDASSFDILEPKNSIIPLKRRCSSYCKVCQRNHDAENPYLYVNFENKLYFNCRRIDESQFIENLTTSEDGSIINSDDISNKIIYIPPSIPEMKHSSPKLELKPFIEDDYNTSTFNPNKKHEYPHLQIVEHKEVKENITPSINVIKKEVKVTKQEKDEHQKLIEKARLKYKKPEEKKSNINSRLEKTYQEIALV